MGLLFLCLYSLPSPPSPPELLLSLSTSPKLSHTNANISSHTTPLISQVTQLISLNSSHTTQLSQELLSCGIWWSCFRVLSLNFTQVLSHNSSHNSHNSSHISQPTHLTPTPLISQLTQPHLTQLHSSHNSQNSSHTTPLMSRYHPTPPTHRNMNVIIPPHPHPTPPRVTDHETAVRVSALQQER